MRCLSLCALLGGLLLAASASAEPVVVETAMTDAAQPPMVVGDNKGLAADLVAALNISQQRYHFRYQLLPTLRMRKQMAAGQIHISLFNNVAWGFEPGTVAASNELLADADHFIALNQPGRDERFFDGVGAVPMVGVRGFHYHYAGYEQSEAVLDLRFNTRLMTSEPAVVSAVLRGQAEIGVVSAALLNYLAGQQPEQFAQLLLSQRVDSRFSRHLVVSNRSPIDVPTLNRLLGCLAANGSLQAIYSRYHLPPPAITPQPCVNPD